MRARLGLVVAAFAIAFPLGARAAAEVDRYLGIAALAEGAGRASLDAPAVGARLDVRSLGPRDRLLDISESLNGTPLRAYAVEMTKTMHLIAISGDFSTFAHLHPTLDANGHFSVVFHAPKSGRYHFYADTSPATLGQRVFRFDVPVTFGDSDASGHSRAIAHPVRTRLVPTALVARTDGYTVTLVPVSERDHKRRATLSASAASLVRVAIFKGGKPANDLHPYLGSVAHAVFVNGSSLAYVHVHPVAGDLLTSPAHHPPAPSTAGMAGMSGMTKMNASPTASVSPVMTLAVDALPPGTYKLWLQFAGGGGLHVAPFVLVAR